MRAIRSILVAIKDPEKRSAAVLGKAAQLARGCGARLELFHALTWPIYAQSDQDFVALRAQEQARVIERLEHLAGRLRAANGHKRLRVSVSSAWDAPGYEAVIRRAEAMGADLIVAERHARRHLAPAVLRFNDWELLRRSPVPVLLVKRGGSYRHPVVLAAVDPTHSMDKPAQLDGRILDLSSVFAQAVGGQLHTVHASETVPPGTRPTQALDPETAAALNRRMIDAARRRYERLLDRYRIPRGRRHLLSAPPAEAIERVSRWLRSSVVVLGAVSRSGWQRLLIGNTAEALLDPLRCDLLIVKPPHFSAQIARRPTGARFVPLSSLMVG